MSANKTDMGAVWVDPDDAPDLSAPEWAAKFDVTPVRRGRPKVSEPKRLTSLRLDADVVDSFRATGPGWQSRINEVLRANKPAGR